MATAREESGYGAGGKFRKRPFRRTTQATPYDRPNITPALRNSNNVNLNSNNGWLSKLVDPAQRLIISSANRLFASVFRKRLPPPPPPPLEPEGSHEAKELHHELISTDGPVTQGAINCHDGPSDGSDKGELTELEQILKQKTFTRSEIDRLTALLHSRTTDVPVGDDQKRPQVIPSKQVVSHDRKEAFLNTPVKENGNGSQQNLTSAVLDEDVASPAELAKAYMGSRPSKVSPPMLGVRSQVLREELTVPSNQPFPSAAPIMSLVPRSSGHVGIPENGFVTPRPRGRSAIYSMARTPYSRVHSTTTLKGAGPAIDSFAGPSSSQSTWEKNRLVESKQGSLKRRSSVLESDIGFVGPIRRIRQKPNLLASKTMSLAPSGSPLSIRASGVSESVQHPSSSMQKPQLASERKHSFTKMLVDNGDNSIPSTSFTSVPSKSSEMASKILQQLDKLVYSREKSPTKLSPLMLRGPALKSLENVDSSNFLENIQDNNRLDGSADSLLPDARDSTSQKRDKVEENGPTKLTSLFDKLVPAMNSVDTTGIVKDDVPSTKTADSALTNSIALTHQQKKRGFQMSAHEDYLELDDDDYSNGPASNPLTEGREKLDTSVVENKTTASESVTVEKPSALSEVMPSSSVMSKMSDAGAHDGPIVTEKSSIFTFPTAPSTSMTVQPAVVTPPSMLTSNKVILTNESTNAPVFSFGEKVASKESNVVPPSFGTSTTNADKVLHFATPATTSVVSESSAPKFGTSLDSKPDSSNGFSSVPVDATDSVPQVPEADKAGNRTILKTEVFSRTPETTLPSAASSSSSIAPIFSFGNSANSSSLNNGSIASNPSSSSSPVPTLFSSTGNNQSTLSSSTVAFATSNCIASSTSTTSATASFTAAAPIFKFGSSAVPSTTASATLAPSGVELTEGKTKDTGIGNSTNVLFGGTTDFASSGSSSSSGKSSAVMGTGSSIFVGTPSAIASTENSIFGGPSPAIASTGSVSFSGTSSALFSAGNSVFGFSAGATSSAATNQVQVSNPFSTGTAQASVNATGFATSTQSVPNQFGSSSSMFGSAGNPAFSSGSSLFGSSTSEAKPFGSAPTFGLSSTPLSEANTISSSSGTSTSVFGTGWQAPKTSTLFGSTFNSTSPPTGFQFGAPASSAASSSASLFGSSSNALSSSIFPFTSAAAATSSQPAFGNVNSVFPFGSTPSNNNNNDQIGMEDSMAEDTVQASAPTVPVFAQQPPSPSFVFGSATASGANPFQFGSQQTPATPQNPSPFQASGSLEFNAGGSFSLGTADKSQRRIVKLKHRTRKK